MNESCKLYRKQSLFALVLYAVVLVISIGIISHFHLGWWRIPIAITPVLPCLLFVRAFVAMMDSFDELEKRIALQSLAFAFAATAVLTLTYGFLQNVGLPDVNWVWVWPLMGSLFMVGKVIAQRRYR